MDNRYYKSNPVYARAIMLNTFAHEYGHHVQNLSGILAASVTRQQKHDAEPEAAREPSA